MRDSDPTPDELRATFETLLAAARTGAAVPSDNALDTETENALWAITNAYPNIPNPLITTARTAFTGQLDGTNAAARKAARLRLFQSHGLQ
ncbi:hypothetical protein [Nocardia sp. XZ_19_385]|uniref:hypothetical protein n=1 Tax=Nocardia sp. XZ_19_385 TaxID=2769488 RepID=UPI001890162B|nr:hypothetical protein [Nocardia sp. XZ_19_385]